MIARRALLQFAACAALLPTWRSALAEPAGADGVFPRRVEHVQGSTLLLRAPRRVAVISTGQLDGALSLGVVPAGTTRVDARERMPAYLAEAFPAQSAALAAMVDLGTRQAPDLEALARLAPDLILLNHTVLRGNGLAVFSQIAPTVVTRGTGAHWRADFLVLADALGRPQQAQALLTALDAQLQAQAARLAAPTSASLLFASGARLRLLGRQSFAGGLLEAMGLTRPPAQRFKGISQDVSAELLDLADANWLFYAEQGGALAGLDRQPLWPQLTAVRQGRAVSVDTDAFYLNAGPAAARYVATTVGRALGVAV